MLGSFFRRILTAAATAFASAALCFSVVYFAPGNPAELLLSRGNPGAGFDLRAVEAYARKMGLDQGLLVQLANWLKGVLRGDFGVSFRTGVPVWEEFTSRIGCTAALMLFAMAVMLVAGIGLGVATALYHNRLFDRLVRLFIAFHMSIPNFWMALLFLWIFALKLKWLPSFGYGSIKNLILPGVVLGLGRSCSVIRTTKSYIMEAVYSPYAITARSKGMKESAVLVRHILKNAMLPVITICGMQMCGMLGGSVIIENIFGLPGIGNYLLTAIKIKDMPVISGFVFLMTLIVILINLAVEALYLLIDPRVRHGNEGKK